MSSPSHLRMSWEFRTCLGVWPHLVPDTSPGAQCLCLKPHVWVCGSKCECVNQGPGVWNGGSVNVCTSGGLDVG